VEYLPLTAGDRACHFQLADDIEGDVIVANPVNIYGDPAQWTGGNVFRILIVLFAAELLQAGLAEGVAMCLETYPQKSRLGLWKMS
jgi:hypothetical protein